MEELSGSLSLRILLAKSKSRSIYAPFLASRTKAACRVCAGGTADSHAEMRAKLRAVAVKTCCKWTLARVHHMRVRQQIMSSQSFMNGGNSLIVGLRSRGGFYMGDDVWRIVIAGLCHMHGCLQPTGSLAFVQKELADHKES